MPFSDQLKLGAIFVAFAAMGPAIAQGSPSAKSKVVGNAHIPKDEVQGVIQLPQHPCPPKYEPMLGYRQFLVVNRTTATLACRMRHPTIGGWSPLVAVPSGGRLVDKKIDIDEIHVQCRAPVKAGAVRVFPGSRYALRQLSGKPEIELLKSQ